jgi:hypothetical protein
MTCPNRVVPDLLYYTAKYVMDSTANKYKIPFPATFDLESLVENKSFIRLMFDEAWDGTAVTSYRYLYRLEDCKNTAAETTKRRMAVHYETPYFYICDSDSTAVCNINVFDLQSDDLFMLDQLLRYRMDSTSVNIFLIDYNSLNTSLSKLIYHYLNFKIRHDYTLFDTTTPIANSASVLENFYESFIIDIIFIYISSLGTEGNPPLIG